MEHGVGTLHRRKLWRIWVKEGILRRSYVDLLFRLFWER